LTATGETFADRRLIQSEHHFNCPAAHLGVFLIRQKI